MFGVSEACEVTIRSACRATPSSVVGRRAVVKVKKSWKERNEVEEEIVVVVVVIVKKVLFHDAALRVHSGTSDTSHRGPEQFLLRQEGASGRSDNNINDKDDDAKRNGIIVNARTATELTTAAKCIL